MKRMGFSSSCCDGCVKHQMRMWVFVANAKKKKKNIGKIKINLQVCMHFMCELCTNFAISRLK